MKKEKDEKPIDKKEEIKKKNGVIHCDTFYLLKKGFISVDELE